MKKNKIFKKNILINKSIRINCKTKDTLNCGMVLLGYEVKLIKYKKFNFSNSSINIINNEAYIIGFKIKKPLNNVKLINMNRSIKLLVRKKEIEKIQQWLKRKIKVVPIKIYLENNKIKITIGTYKYTDISNKILLTERIDKNARQIKSKYFY